MKITGTGNITAFTTGKEDFISYITTGEPQLKPLEPFIDIVRIPGGLIGDAVMSEPDDQRALRRMARVSRYAISAIKMAIRDAGGDDIEPGETALIVALTHGALNYTCEYHSSIVDSSSVDISPLLFSESVLNAPAGNASIYFGINGPVHTIVGGNTVGLKAIGLAVHILSAGICSRVVVAASEEMNRLSLFCRSRLGESAISEGAAAIVVDQSDTSTEAYCYITAIVSFFMPDKPEESLKIALNRALRKAGLSLTDIGMVITDRPELFPDMRSIQLRRLFGNCFSVSSMINLLAGVLLFREDVLKDTFEIRDIENILVCDVEKTGETSVVILSRP